MGGYLKARHSPAVFLSFSGNREQQKRGQMASSGRPRRLDAASSHSRTVHTGSPRTQRPWTACALRMEEAAAAEPSGRRALLRGNGTSAPPARSTAGICQGARKLAATGMERKGEGGGDFGGRRLRKGPAIPIN